MFRSSVSARSANLEDKSLVLIFVGLYILIKIRRRHCTQKLVEWRILLDPLVFHFIFYANL